MKIGDAIRIHLDDEHNETVNGQVVRILDNGFVHAMITDDEHPLAMHNDKNRLLTCSPDRYEKKRKARN